MLNKFFTENRTRKIFERENSNSEYGDMASIKDSRKLQAIKTKPQFFLHTIFYNFRKYMKFLIEYGAQIKNTYTGKILTIMKIRIH